MNKAKLHSELSAKYDNKSAETERLSSIDRPELSDVYSEDKQAFANFTR